MMVTRYSEVAGSSLALGWFCPKSWLPVICERSCLMVSTQPIGSMPM